MNRSPWPTIWPGEQSARTKHEHLDGRIFAMLGGRNVRNRIASKVLGSLFRQLSQSPCEAYNSDTKIRVRKEERTFFYYADGSVIRQSNPDSDTFQDQPVPIVEVVSEITRRVDEGKKRDHYLSIGSLQAYALLEQERPAAVVFQRLSDGTFAKAIYDHLSAVIEFSPGVKLSLRELHER